MADQYNRLIVSLDQETEFIREDIEASEGQLAVDLNDDEEDITGAPEIDLNDDEEDITGGAEIDTVRFDDLDVGVTVDLAAGSAERDTGFALTITDLTLVNPNDGIVADQIVSAGIVGNLYFNFHTSDFPSGELRGQLDLVADNRNANGVGTVKFTASLSGDQEVPAPADTDASGTATTILTVASDGSVTYSTEVSVVGLNQADLLPVNIGNGTLSPIHIHNTGRGQRPCCSRCRNRCWPWGNRSYL